MENIIDALKGTPVPTILIVAGIFFVFIAIGGQFGARLLTKQVNRRLSATVGVLLFVVGLAMSLAPTDRETRESQIIKEPSGGNSNPNAATYREKLIGIWYDEFEEVAGTRSTYTMGTTEYLRNGTTVFKGQIAFREIYQGNWVELVYDLFGTGEWQLDDEWLTLKIVDLKSMPRSRTLNGVQVDLRQLNQATAEQLRKVEELIPKGTSSQLEILEF